MSLYRKKQVTNARLYYNICDTTAPTFDAITGRPVFTTTEQVLELSLEPDETEATVWSNPGNDVYEVRYSGRCVNPDIIPAEIKPGTQYRLEYEFSCNVWLNGRITIYQTTPSKFPTARKRFGDYIYGVLVTEPNTIV